MLRHNENLDSKEKIKYDLYKILRMSILLNQNETDKLTLKKFKEASLNIDKMLGESYDEKLESLFYTTTSLEEEEKRLKDLVLCINDRLEKRKNLLDDYRSVTNQELNDLDYITKSSEIDLYEDRLNTIREYLDNSKLIKVNTEDLASLREELSKEFTLKNENEIINVKIEEKLFNTFVNILYEMDLYSSLELENIDKEIEELQNEIIETKEQKDTFTTAFENLKSSGISGDLELEYASYVENSKRNYYYVKEKEIILKLCKLLGEKEADYSNLYSKRETVKNLLLERFELRKELEIKEKDLMAKVFDLLEEQNEEIEGQTENIDNINVLTERIRLKENRLEELRKLVRMPEILSILKEYSLIDTYDHEDIIDDSDDYNTMTLEEPIIDDDSELDLLKDLLPEEDDDEITFEEEPVKEYQPNQIKDSSVVPSMNFGLSRLKSISVMKRVADMLGVSIKKDEVPVVEELKEEEIFVSPEPVQEEKQELVPEVTMPVSEQTGNSSDDLFWTPGEFMEMQSEVEENSNNTDTKDNLIFVNSTELVDNTPVQTNESPIFEFEMPEMKETPIDNQIFENTNTNNELIFPEPVMPELGQVFPENKEETFMWPENSETLDINGIFPN